MKKQILVWTILLITFLLSGCQFMNDILQSSTYTVNFHTNGGEELVSIEVTDFKGVNFNETSTPEYVGHTFEGWYLDVSLESMYTPMNDYKSNLDLYAKWRVNTYDITVIDTFNHTTSSYLIEHGQTLESLTYNHEGVDLVSFKTKDTNIEVLLTTPIVENLNLYTVYSSKSTHYIVTFVTNVAIDFPIQTVLKDSEAMPLLVVDITGYFLVGWFLDEAFTEVYDFDQIVESDLTLYVKLVEAHTLTYSIEDTTLSWEAHPDAVSYDLRYQSSGENNPVLISTDEPFIDLSILSNEIGNGKDIVVYAVFYHSSSHPIFEVSLKFDYVTTMYETDFEEESFTARTNYSNNATIRKDGPEGFKFNILNGTASTTNPISGQKSIQLRNNTNTPYLETDFRLEGIAKITFLAKSNNHHLDLKLISISGSVLEVKTFELTNNALTYEVNVNITEPVTLRFELHPTSDITTGEQIFIDDIKVYGINSPKVLVEIKKDTEPDSDIEAIIARFAAHRSNLTPPGFNALSSAGVLDYYASLNGLTGSEFKQELTNILTTTHRRLINYDEARFILEQSDLVTIGQKSYLDGIYSGHEIIPYWDGGATWAREHVWPNSRLGIPRVTGSSRNQGTDVHNLRAINPSVNSSRSNRYFLEGDSFGLVGTLGYYPGDQYKGDVARILFYMLARYPEILTLRDEDIIDSAYTKEGAVMGILSLLITWHNEDPVSAFEIYRNEVIYTYQGNRNPFIDNPEYVDVYFS